MMYATLVEKYTRKQFFWDFWQQTISLCSFRPCITVTARVLTEEDVPAKPVAGDRTMGLAALVSLLK